MDFITLRNVSQKQKQMKYSWGLWYEAGYQLAHFTLGLSVRYGGWFIVYFQFWPQSCVIVCGINEEKSNQNEMKI